MHVSHYARLFLPHTFSLSPFLPLSLVLGSVCACVCECLTCCALQWSYRPSFKRELFALPAATPPLENGFDIAAATSSHSGRNRIWLRLI